MEPKPDDHEDARALAIAQRLAALAGLSRDRTRLDEISLELDSFQPERTIVQVLQDCVSVETEAAEAAAFQAELHKRARPAGV